MRERTTATVREWAAGRSLGEGLIAVAPDVPAFAAAHLDAAADDLADGVLMSSAPGLDGRPFLVALGRDEPRLVDALGEGFEALAAIAIELGGALGLLRPERRLVTVDDARALLADPRAPSQLRDVLRPAL